LREKIKEAKEKRNDKQRQMAEVLWPSWNSNN
jgi:hypothetical protein